jgi:Transferrin
VALINERDVERIKTFENFKGARACFPEFDGIAAISFINVAKSRGIFKREDCSFGPLLGNYFSESCLPGSKSVFHDPKIENPESLCSLCQTQLHLTTSTTENIIPLAGALDDEEEGEYDDEGKALRTTPDGIEGSEDTLPIVPNRAVNCAASPSNRFYGTRGALTCLNEVGEVAVIEYQKLAEHARSLNLNPNDFRIICRNGSLANAPGFDVDSNCFLTTIVDGEIVVRRNNPKNLGIVNALLSLDTYLQTDPDFKLYNIFNGEKDLLFEDSALGLVSPNDTEHGLSVQNYIKLFQDVENCISEMSGDSATSVSFNVLLSFTLILVTMFIRI